MFVDNCNIDFPKKDQHLPTYEEQIQYHKYFLKEDLMKITITCYNVYLNFLNQCERVRYMEILIYGDDDDDDDKWR